MSGGFKPPFYWSAIANRRSLGASLVQFSSEMILFDAF
jgi:hypothetical protein